MISVHDGRMYSSALITDVDDYSCGLCDSRRPMEPAHAYTEHLEVTFRRARVAHLRDDDRRVSPS